MLLISLRRLLRGRGHRPAGGPGGRDVGSHLQVTERLWLGRFPLIQLVKGYTLPTPPALLPAHDFKGQGHIHFAEEILRPRKGRKLLEVTQPGGGRASLREPYSLLLCSLSRDLPTP